MRTERALLRARRQLQWPTGADRVAELPWLIRQVLFEDQVLTHVPALEAAAQNQFEFDLAFLFFSRHCVRIGEVAGAVVANNFKQTLVCSVDVFEFDVKNRIDPVLARQRPETVLPAKSGKDRAVVRHGGTVEI